MPSCSISSVTTASTSPLSPEWYSVFDIFSDPPQFRWFNRTTLNPATHAFSAVPRM